MSDRQAVIDAFLQGSDWQHADRKAMQQDASFRRYYRLKRANGTSSILMDAPPPERPVADFAKVADHLITLGLRAPKPLKIDDFQGLMLLEDLGNTTMSKALADGQDEAQLYLLAVNELLKLHQNQAAIEIDVPAYEQATLDTEAALLCDWFYPYSQKQPISADVKAAYFDAWQQTYQHSDMLKLSQQDRTIPQSLVLRDYHVDNIMLLDQADGSLTCALLDFQDALIGSPAYDLVSLLEDARRDIPQSLIDKMLMHYFQQRPELDRSAFMQDYTTLGVQRHCKVAGIFIRLYQRDNKSHYLKHIPRVLNLLQQGLNAPHMQALQSWFAQHLALDNIDPELFSSSIHSK